MIQAIIFSKDRACQLDLLLRSMPDTFNAVVVIYTYSNEKYKAGYDLIKADDYGMRDLWFQIQKDFRQDLLAFADSNAAYTVFFVDDNVFVRDWQYIDFYDFDMPEDVVCFSLRLHPHLTYCYTLARPMKQPSFGLNLTWNWQNADADYGYPMSLDGHVFRTYDIVPKLRKLIYSNPNELEGQLARHPIMRPKMMCLEKPVIINNPVNKVQTVNSNRHGDVSAEYLNDMFLQGKRIDLTPFNGYTGKAVHEELPCLLV